MFDYHALVDTTGSVAAALANISVAANIPANDGQTAPGVPIAPGAILKLWGGYTTIADTLHSLQLISQDQVDSINGEAWLPGAASVLGMAAFESYLPYSRGGRNIHYRQNTGAAPIHAFLIDQYANPGGTQPRNYGQCIKITQTMGALTANLWGSTPVAPAVNIPAGKYALLGAFAAGLTNYASLRFRHADFGGKAPGFPVVDESKAAARAVLPMAAPVFNHTGSQFVAMGDVPIFNATSAGTGLVIDGLAITADTPIVTLNLQQVS